MVVAKGCWRKAEQNTGEGRGGRRIFLQGTRVRNDPKGENQVETPRTVDAHNAARVEAHIYF